MKKHLFTFTAVIILLSVIAAALLACNGRGKAQPAGELRYGITTEPKTLDPLNPSNTADGRSILFNVFEGLVKPDTAGRMQPCAAVSWTVENGGLAYNFTLREGVRFHDGSILTSADVRFTLDTAAAAGFQGFTQIARIETPDDRTVRVILNEPDPEFLPYIAVGIVKADNPDREKNVIGTGPYFIESYTTQRSLVLRRFESYWQPFDAAAKETPQGTQAVPLEKVTIVFMADSNAMVLGLKGGGIDGATLTGAWMQQLDPAKFYIVPGFSAAVQLLALNNAHKPLDDLRVRAAINYGVDIHEIIAAAFQGEGTPSGSPLIPGLADYYEQSLALAYPVDRERARDLLAQAGYGENQKLSLEITVPSNYTMHVDTAQVIASQLEKIGIQTTIKQVEWGTWLSEVYMNRNYEATIISLDAAVVSPRLFLSYYYGGQGGNFINYANADFDRAYNAARVESDTEKRIALYKECQLIASQDAASVFLQDITGFTVLRGGAYGGVLNYPLYAIDFAAIYGIERTE